MKSINKRNFLVLLSLLTSNLLASTNSSSHLALYENGLSVIPEPKSPKYLHGHVSQLVADYTQSDLNKMIHLVVDTSTSNVMYRVQMYGSALKDDKVPLLSGLDTGSKSVLIPEDFINQDQVEIVQKCVNSPWGFAAHLVTGEISLKSSNGEISYTAEKLPIYMLLESPEKSGCDKNLGTYNGKKINLGAGFKLSNPVIYDQKKCAGGFFNFLDYSKYNSGKKIFSIISFSSAGLAPAPNIDSAKQISTYVSIGEIPKIPENSKIMYFPINKQATAPCDNAAFNGNIIGYENGNRIVDIPVYRVVVSDPTNEREKVTLTLGTEAGQLGLNGYAAVDTDGGLASLTSSADNPSLDRLEENDYIEECRGHEWLKDHKCLKKGMLVTVHLINLSSEEYEEQNYSYRVTDPNQDLSFAMAFNKKLPKNMAESFNPGFSLFYQANTISFNFEDDDEHAYTTGVVLGGPLALPAAPG